MILAGVSGADAALIEDLVDRYGIAFDTSDRELILGCVSDDAVTSARQFTVEP